MSKLRKEVTFDSILRQYEDGLLSKLELYYCLLIRAEGEDPDSYLARIPVEHRHGFEETIKNFPLDGTGIDIAYGFDPPPDDVVRGLQSAIIRKRWSAEDQ